MSNTVHFIKSCWLRQIRPRLNTLILFKALYVSKWMCNKYIWYMLIKILVKYCNILYKVKLEEWGASPIPSAYEADMLTVWLNAWAASQAASSLPILIGIITLLPLYLKDSPHSHNKYKARQPGSWWGYQLTKTGSKWMSTGNIWNLAYWISDSLLYWNISHTHVSYEQV